ncbi:MAG: aminotransferase class III-fold pyridoxal phosphate-dependent enzyme [Rubrivivax sp.]|nr:aminotransferase class III-fold pyridoxal phosphate-dependent enzyme [Rubrivivax sp.]
MEPLVLGGAALAGLALTWPLAQRRLELSLAKHPSLTGHARMARRVSRWLPGYAYGDERFFNADDAPAEIQQRRRAAFKLLSVDLNGRHARSIALTQRVREQIPDLQFTSTYRVPFQFSPYLRQRLAIGAFVQRSDGVWVEDLDGQRFIDLAGSYGVNVFGHDFYKRCIAEGSARVADLGPVLGSYHPLVADNVAELCRISGQQAVSFHMSGTEAVMQAVRLARYHTRRPVLVRFSGAYHGWWDDVQPGPGNPTAPGRTFTLKEMDADTLRVLRKRRDIACVLVNPLQALHPNRAAPGDSALVDSSRQAHFDRTAYTAWLQQLRQVCSARGIALIFDEVFMGFRLAPGGAQEYFGVRADLVTYGKTLGGGLPVGVVCGQASWMKRFREERPADICFARGTFNSHPYVMGAMQVFLQQLRSPALQALYADLDTRWDGRARLLNDRLQVAGLPVRVANLSSVWTVHYTQPSRYNWMLQFYLRQQGLGLSWVGTGRLIFSLDFGDADFEAVCERFTAAAQAMQRDGWWWQAPGASNQAIRRGLLREMLRARF